MMVYVDGVFTDEAKYEPVELIRASRTVVRVGLMLLTAGSGSYRVKAQWPKWGPHWG